MAKTAKTVHFDDGQIEEVDKLNEDHPVYQGRGFAAIVRMLVDLALSIVRGGEEIEAKDEREER